MIILTPHSLTKAGWFTPETESLTLGEKDGQTVFTLPMDSETQISQDAWLMEEDEPGAGTVWRVKSIEDNTQTGTRTITAEHIIQTLRDKVIFGEITPADMGGSAEECSAEQAVRYALGKQSDWILGGIGYSARAGYTFNGDSVMEALETVCSTLEDPWWSYDLSSYPFKLYINPKDRSAACEMRGGRNLGSMRRVVDRSRMYTRIYPIGKDNLRLPESYLEMNAGTYGVIEKVQTDQSQETEAALRRWALGRLRRHAEPAVSVTVTGLELSQDTGEPLDRLTVGRGCRVPLPEYGTVILETIVKITWRDKMHDKESCTVTLANTVTDVASIIRQERAEGAGSSGRGGRAGAKKAEEDHAWFVDTTDHVAMVAEAVAGPGAPADWSRVAEVVVDGKGIHQRVTEAEGAIVTHESRVEQTEKSWRTLLTGRTLNASLLHEYASRSGFPATGQKGHYYHDKANDQWYTWTGSGYGRANVVTNEKDGQITGYSLSVGEIALYLNDSDEAEAYIDAKKIILGQAELSQKDLDDWAGDAVNGEGVFAKYLTVKKLSAQEIITQILKGKSIEVGTLHVEGISEFYQQVTAEAGLVSYEPVKATAFKLWNPDGATLNVIDAEVNGNVLTLHRVSGGDLTFSKATQLSGSWSGGTYKVTAKQNGKSVGELQTKLGNLVSTGSVTVIGKTVFQKQRVMYEEGSENFRWTGAELSAMVDASSVYNKGWAAARAKVSLPSSSSSAESFSVSVPPAAVDGAATGDTYTLHSASNDVVVVRNSGSTIVARIEHGKYTAGYNAGYAAGGGGSSGSHSPSATASIGWTGSISGRTSLGSATASSLSHTYILIDAKCGGETKKYYITLN